MAPVSSTPFCRWGAQFRPALLLAAGALLAGCNKDAPPASAEPQSASARADVAAAATATPAALKAAADPTAAGVPAASKLSEESFELALVTRGDYAVGKPAEVDVVLDAKGPYKVNDQYPYKFKLKESPGLKYPSMIVGKDRVKLEKKRATIAVPFTPEKAGPHVLAGQFAFSVCTDDKCLIEKRDLSLTVEAK